MRVIDFFDNGAKLYPENLAFVAGSESMTYTEASNWSHHIASAMRGRRYPKRTRVGILAPNSIEAFISLIGAFRAESVWLPVNPRNSVESNISFLHRLGCELLFYHSTYALEAKRIQSDVPAIREIVCLDGPEGKLDGLSAWVHGYQKPHAMDAEDPDEFFTIYPTGGTTGRPKAVMITHRNNATMYGSLYAHFRYHNDTRHLVVAPMTHTSGLLGAAHFARGGTNYIINETRPEVIMHNVQLFRITHLFLPPTLLYAILALPNVREYDVSSLQHLFIGSAPSSLKKKIEAVEIFGPVLSETFGQSEAPMILTAKAPWDYMNSDGSINSERMASVGRPTVLSRVAILADSGVEVPRGERGEVCAQGDLVTPGYYENPEATAEIRQFGWHHTGDIGVMDRDGFITIVDRKKDMIISGGFNVYPNEIEQILTQHSAVQECSVIGVPDEKWGEAVKAVVQLKPGAHATEEELISLAKQKLGSVKAPKSIDFVTELPRSSVGKILKASLREKYWQGFDRGVN